MARLSAGEREALRIAARGWAPWNCMPCEAVYRNMCPAHLPGAAHDRNARHCVFITFGSWCGHDDLFLGEYDSISDCRSIMRQAERYLDRVYAKESSRAKAERRGKYAPESV